MNKKPIFINTKHQEILELIYPQQYQRILDISHFSGINTICSFSQLTEMQRQFQRTKADFYFLGTGNFHYLSYLLLENQHQPFSLLVFDHHNDASPSPYPDYITCGSWIAAAIENNMWLEQVYIIGMGEANSLPMAPEIAEKVTIFPERELTQKNMQELSQKLQTKRLYLSVDRDILAVEEVRTTWNQGQLTATELTDYLAIFVKDNQVIGKDICGDLDWDYWELRRYQSKKEQQKSYQVNQALIKVLTQASPALALKK